MTLAGLTIVSLASLGSCSRQQLADGAYESGYQRECIVRTGVADCDPEHPRYEEYRQARDAEVK